jgi:hypothetical protein
MCASSNANLTRKLQNGGIVSLSFVFREFLLKVISWPLPPLKPGESVGLETCESLLYKKMYDKFSIQFNNMQIIVAKVSSQLFVQNLNIY